MLVTFVSALLQTGTFEPVKVADCSNGTMPLQAIHIVGASPNRPLTHLTLLPAAPVSTVEM